MPISHPNAKRYWFTLEVADGGMKQIMVVETDLHLNSSHPGHDSGAVDSLLATIQGFMVTEAPHIQNVRIVSIRKYDAKA